MKDIYKWILLAVSSALAIYLVLSALYAPEQELNLLTSSPISSRRQQANWKTYQNQSYDFEIKYPKIYILDLGASPTYYVGEYFLGGGKNIVTIELWPAVTYAGTNFLDAFVTISVGNKGMSETSCKKAQRLGVGQNITLSETRMINDLTFYGGELEGAVAGTWAKGRVYHAYVDNTCYEVSLNLFQGKLDNKQLDTVKQVDESKVFSKLEAVLTTFRLISSAKQ